MTVQFVEIAGQKMAMLPVADYERLVDLAEDRTDAVAAVAAAVRRDAGEDYLPVESVDRLMAGESPLRVWREHRGLSQARLAEMADCTHPLISKLERSGSGASQAQWRRLSAALNVPLDDLIPNE